MSGIVSEASLPDEGLLKQERHHRIDIWGMSWHGNGAGTGQVCPEDHGCWRTETQAQQTLGQHFRCINSTESLWETL